MSKNISFYINKSEDNDFIKHAISEFRFMKWLNEDNSFCSKETQDNCFYILSVLDTVTEDNYCEVYNSLDYSDIGFNIKRLLKLKPISLFIDDIEDEWEKIEDNKFQNKRYCSIFKIVDDNGKTVSAYNIDGKVIYNENGDETYAPYEETKVDIIFPYFVF